MPELVMLVRVRRGRRLHRARARTGARSSSPGHSEYDPLTLKGEYERDVDKGLPIRGAEQLLPGGRPDREPRGALARPRHLLFANWLNYHVYQKTPYDLATLPAKDGRKG